MQSSSYAIPGEGAHQRARATIGSWAGAANQAVQQLTVRRYALPDKNVASQILMYRQLLHTKCRPGLKLSRDYQGTPAQQAVLHMPWWSEGILETKKMIISYDNLIQRLWLQGAIIHSGEGFVSQASNSPRGNSITSNCASSSDETSQRFTDSSNVDGDDTVTATEPAVNIQTLLNDEGLPPTPHEYWVSRLGFQQPDPVTDFRSGGVLSLAMMVWVVESCPNVFKRYARVPVPGDASVLPFGITSINVTDMMSKFLMLSKSTDKMDTLLSQKPFWKMFADPSALLACQELAMDMLADVVQELYLVRERENGEGKVTVFDFSHILSVTEKRVEFDLLGSGPTSVEELRLVHSRLKARYDKQLQQKLQRMGTSSYPPSAVGALGLQPNTASNNDSKEQKLTPTIPVITPQKVKEEVRKGVTGLGAVASSFTGSVFSIMKSPVQNDHHDQPQHQSTSARGTSGIFSSSLFGFPSQEHSSHHDNPTSNPETVSLKPELLNIAPSVPPVEGITFLHGDDELFGDFVTAASNFTTVPPVSHGESETKSNQNNDNEFGLLDGEWNTDLQHATAGVSNFSIGGEEDDDDLI